METLQETYGDRTSLFLNTLNLPDMQGARTRSVPERNPHEAGLKGRRQKRSNGATVVSLRKANNILLSRISHPE